MSKPTILVCSGPRATITNSPPLVTSAEGRAAEEGGERDRYRHLVSQRLHEPVTVAIEKYSAHPLEEDASEVYHDDGEEYYEVTLEPGDGPIPLPYVARRDDGTPTGTPFEPEDLSDPEIEYGGRQFFYPDASRIFEEIDRTVHGRDGDGTAGILRRKAEYDFVRALPPGGYTTRGEERGEDFFPYKPSALAKNPRLRDLATIANTVQHNLDAGEYDGVIWLEGSPRLEETLYWLQLLVDTRVPIVGHVANRPHGQLSNDGDRNIVDGVEYVVSGEGRGRGAVAIQDQVVYAGRDFKKGDSRPGGFTAVGGPGGKLGTVGDAVRIPYEPTYAHTADSAVNLTALPEVVTFHDQYGDEEPTSVHVKDADGLRGSAIPRVSLIKGIAYPQVETGETPEREVDVMARIDQARTERAAADRPSLHGLVFEGTAPYASSSPSMGAALDRATFSGIPVVRVGRADPGGFVPPSTDRPTIEGSNLDANKAVLLLMAALLKLGRLPRAADPADPTPAEREAVMDRVREFQQIFRTH